MITLAFMAATLAGLWFYNRHINRKYPSPSPRDMGWEPGNKPPRIPREQDLRRPR